VLSYNKDLSSPFLSPILQIPTTIADNAGYDSADLVSQLRAAHNDGFDTSGLGMSAYFLRAAVSISSWLVS